MAPNLQRLVAVTGYNERVNDVIFVERQISTDPASVVVFFGGDVQAGYHINLHTNCGINNFSNYFDCRITLRI